MLVKTPPRLIRQRRTSGAGRRAGVLLQRLALLGLALAAWQLGSLQAPSFVLPSPARVWNCWLGLVATPGFAADLGITLGRIGAGLAFAALVGLPLGLLLGASHGSAGSLNRC